ncbi:hypothetical protein Kpol_1001p13 [Vanderwaltozyma polyspora DSM 70294]|uniref:ATP-dependent DNA helicase PIF1 n=1 Tax=Vanderwaltozyma polyspora (strain ATCC 22028 / DSM 70294 / BCRC 21397 / CBS 2163 / NBRC 10782 / NRRL Y-8283 / UCD 57-17) TaxID=436907 RepID=A7TNQ0_VANPO|nr:uncharacterized protein Kpol_1001p13 [Vanderwaltozyma polyspora DSM 70294]EDO16101.1 hypothetical protein Kpol_1001p13 [Vanderwaltozyma polyspora DSM 70294]
MGLRNWEIFQKIGKLYLKSLTGVSKDYKATNRSSIYLRRQMATFNNVWNDKKRKISSDDLNDLLSDTGDWEVTDNLVPKREDPIARKNIVTATGDSKNSKKLQKLKSNISSDDYDDDLLILKMFGKQNNKKLTGGNIVSSNHIQNPPQQLNSSFSGLFDKTEVAKSTQIINKTPKLLDLKKEEDALKAIDFTDIDIVSDFRESSSSSSFSSPKPNIPPVIVIEEEGPLFIQSQLEADAKMIEHISEIDKKEALLKNSEDIPIKNAISTAKDSTGLRNINVERTEIPDSDILESSVIITKSETKKNVKEDIPNQNVTATVYGEKFRFLTQRPGYADIDDETKKLNLPERTKVKIPIRLSKEQEDIIKLAEKGFNIFYTGSAGTGKSVLLREMIKALRNKYGHEKVAVTASTGLAACNIGGITVHSFAGIGLGNGDTNNLYKKVRRSRKHLNRWQKIKVLVVDEISMLNGELLDKLDVIAQKIRRSKRAFGNIQLIFCGDFFQLPPVSKNTDNPSTFAFESRLWKDGIDVTIMLQKVFRQEGDSKFIDMLNKMRLGEIDIETETEFKKLSRELEKDEIIPAELYSTRYEVEKANNSRLAKLPGATMKYHAIDGGSLEDTELKERLLQNFLAPKELKLKIGAQVMMIKNIDATLVNGSLGKVIDFMDPETYMFYEIIVRNPTLDVDELETLKKDPSLLKEAWKSESDDEENGTAVRNKLVKEAFCKTEEDYKISSLGVNIFDFLSNVSGDSTEIIDNINRKKNLLQEIHKSSTGKRKLPLVRFKNSDMSSRTVLVEPEDWSIEDENEKPIVSRIQLPLMLAWSLSIHKSQGQTLPKVKVDLKNVFEKGQAYVALSRAVSRDGLQVLNFDRSRIQAHEKVLDFYNTLLSADDALKKLNNKDKTDDDNYTVGGNKGSNRFAPKYDYEKVNNESGDARYRIGKGITAMLAANKRKNFIEKDNNF